MRERFSEDTRWAIHEAQYEALDLGRSAVGSEHLIAGILTRSDTRAALLLNNSGITLQAVRDRLSDEPDDRDALGSIGVELEDVRESVEGSFGAGAYVSARRLAAFASGGGMPLSTDAKAAIKIGLEAAIRLGFPTVQPEHLLLGILEQGGEGASVLTELGVTEDAIRTALSAPDPGPTA